MKQSSDGLEAQKKSKVGYLVMLLLGIFIGWLLSVMASNRTYSGVGESINSPSEQLRRNENIVVRPSSAAPADKVCNRSFLDELERDENLTKLQKDHKIVTACAGRTVKIKGRVTRADFQSSFEIKDLEGLEWDLSLVAGHNCGNLLNLSKGQEINAIGVIKNGFAHLTRFYLVNADCVIG